MNKIVLNKKFAYFSAQRIMMEFPEALLSNNLSHPMHSHLKGICIVKSEIHTDLPDKKVLHIAMYVLLGKVK